MSLTVACKYCQNEFLINNPSQNRPYCDDACKDRGRNNQTNCPICGSNFDNPSEKITCSTKCLLKYIKKFKLTHIKPSDNFKSLREIHKLKPEYVHVGKTSNIFGDVLTNALISNSKVVKKSWGLEVHIVNNPQYCLKYLIFYAGKHFSFHKHLIKKELWHCICGRFECVLDEKNPTYSIFKEGDKMQIEPGLAHQLQALENSILVEISTPDFPEDSIRLIECNN